MTAFTGKIENIERMASSRNGNPRYKFTVAGKSVKLAPDSSWGYCITNLRNRHVTVEVTPLQHLVKSICAADHWEVEELDASGGWENNWHDETGQPQTFSTRGEAHAELDDLLESVQLAVADGHMAAEYSREDYRVVMVGGRAI